MQLVYQWIDKYRNISNTNLLDNLQLNFHHKYRFKYDGKEKLEFEILENTNYIGSYYKENQYYSMIVGKNGSGKSSIFEILYNGINLSYDMKNKKENIRDRFIAIFLDEDRFLFYGFEINGQNEIYVSRIESINKINLDIKYRECIDNLRILSINSDFGSLENIETNYEMSRERIKISDNIKKKDITTFLLDRHQSYENNSFINSSMYESILNYSKNDFTQSFLLNYKYFKSIENNDIELPQYVYFKFDIPPKNYYENKFKKVINENSEKINNFLIELSKTLLDYYDSIKLSSELSIFHKIESFYIFYLIDKYLFYTSDINVFSDTLLKVDIISKIKNIDFGNLDNLYFDDAIDIRFNPFGEFLILKDIIFILQNTHHKVINNTIVINRLENQEYMRNLTLCVDSFKQIFTLGQIYLSYDFYPILSSGHQQLFKTFNYILEGIHQFIKDGDSYTKDVLILLDEPDIRLHYEWQRNYVKWLSIFLEQFKDFNFHIIINTHSNLMLSDIPKENVIVLDRKDNKTIIKNATSQTLAQNLFENLNNDFFLDKFIGGYIEDKIIAILKKDIITSDEKELINNLGEKILRVSLEMKYDIESK
jgi:energy-coupling factor transporter ATP-binding protein EcfA2